MKPRVIILDNGGVTFDRYTACIQEDEGGAWECYTLSHNANTPQGVNQYAGSTLCKPFQGVGETRIPLRKCPMGVKLALAHRFQRGLVESNRLPGAFDPVLS